MKLERENKPTKAVRRAAEVRVASIVYGWREFRSVCVRWRDGGEGREGKRREEKGRFECEFCCVDRERERWDCSYHVCSSSATESARGVNKSSLFPFFLSFFPLSFLLVLLFVSLACFLRANSSERVLTTPVRPTTASSATPPSGNLPPPPTRAMPPFHRSSDPPLHRHLSRQHRRRWLAPSPADPSWRRCWRVRLGWRAPKAGEQLREGQ